MCSAVQESVCGQLVDGVGEGEASREEAGAREPGSTGDARSTNYLGT